MALKEIFSQLGWVFEWWIFVFTLNIFCLLFIYLHLCGSKFRVDNTGNYVQYGRYRTSGTQASALGSEVSLRLLASMKL